MNDARGSRRFAFGENWARLLPRIDEARIEGAVASVKDLLVCSDFSGRSFLDVGSGSGLFSLAARSLSARVVSFDYDSDSVRCTRNLRQEHFPQASDAEWRVERGSVLDADFMRSLGQFDVVYAWGVLHHTGDMRTAMENAAQAVKPGGTLCVSIYNDQGWKSRYWRAVKLLYNTHPLLKLAVILAHIWPLYFLRIAVRRLLGKHRIERGMSVWVDMLDWLGGYPFEVSTPDRVIDFYVARHFHLIRLRGCGGRMGCNEFVFHRSAEDPAQRSNG